MQQPFLVAEAYFVSPDHIRLEDRFDTELRFGSTSGVDEGLFDLRERVLADLGESTGLDLAKIESVGDLVSAYDEVKKRGTARSIDLPRRDPTNR